MPDVSPPMTDSILKIFTDATGTISGMLVPIITAGSVVMVGLLAFNAGKRIFKTSIK